MTREHLFFIPFVLFLGVILGSQATRARFVESNSSATRVRVRGVLLPLAAFAVLFFLTHVFATHGGAKSVEDALQGQPLFDQRASFDAEEVYRRLQFFGEEGRTRYQHMTFTSDLVFPLVLLTFLLQLARFVGERSTQSITARRVAMVLPLLWFTSDIFENAMVYTLIEQFPTSNLTLASLLGAITSLKFGLLVASVAYLALLGVGRRAGTNVASHE